MALYHLGALPYREWQIGALSLSLRTGDAGITPPPHRDWNPIRNPTLPHRPRSNGDTSSPLVMQR